MDKKSFRFVKDNCLTQPPPHNHVFLNFDVGFGRTSQPRPRNDSARHNARDVCFDCTLLLWRACKPHTTSQSTICRSEEIGTQHHSRCPVSNVRVLVRQLIVAFCSVSECPSHVVLARQARLPHVNLLLW